MSILIFIAIVIVFAFVAISNNKQKELQRANLFKEKVSNVKLGVSKENLSAHIADILIVSNWTKFSKIQFKRNLEVINDCFNILKSTSDYDTFNTRYNLLIVQLTNLHNNFGLSFFGANTTKAFFMSYLAENIYSKFHEKFITLKTSTGKKNNVVKTVDLYNKISYDSNDFDVCKIIDEYLEKVSKATV